MLSISWRLRQRLAGTAIRAGWLAVCRWDKPRLGFTRIAALFARSPCLDRQNAVRGASHAVEERRIRANVYAKRRSGRGGGSWLIQAEHLHVYLSVAVREPGSRWHHAVDHQDRRSAKRQKRAAVRRSASGRARSRATPR